MNLVLKQLNELLPASYNPRKINSKELDRLAASIKAFGYVEPIIFNKTTATVVGGHQRVKALKQLGYTEVEVVEVELEEEQEKALNLALNKISGEWDAEKLEDLLRDLQLNSDLDIELTGFTQEEVNDLMGSIDTSIDASGVPSEKEVEEDNFDTEQEIEAVAKYGDIWQLGRHRLMCGDSTKAEEVAKLMDGAKADLVHTDPPYGMKKESAGVLNDNLNFEDLLNFNKRWIPLTFESLKETGSWYCWGIDEPLMDIYVEILKPKIRKNEITFRNLITWDKTTATGGQMSDLLRMYATADEKCLFVMCGVQGFSNNTEDYFEGFEKIRQYLETEAKRVGLTSKKLKEICGVSMYSHWFSKAQWVMIPEEHYKKLQDYYKGEAFTEDYNGLNKDYTAIKREYDEIKAEWYKCRAYFNNVHDNMNSVWHFDRTSQKERELTGGHATPKPLALCSRAVKSSSREGEIVLDVFGGSGSTLIACEQLNRICYMCELDPHYVDVIIKRWETLTGQKAERVYEGNHVESIG